MNVVSMAEEIKKEHPEEVVCYKMGAFIQSFGKDAYIISCLFDYNVKEIKGTVPSCGFPKRAISKVCAKLEQKKINYVIIDTKNDYKIEEKSGNKNLNEYRKILEKAEKYVKVRKRIRIIEQELLKQAEKENIMEKIRKIEEVTYENRKI